MKSCIVFSSPRAGTHLVMTGLDRMGMVEARALTQPEWDTLDWSKLVDMPSEGYFRFGAHMTDPHLFRAYRESDLCGIYVTREEEPQVRSYRAFLSVNQKRDITHKEARQEVRDRRLLNDIWATQPRVLTVRFEDLIAGRSWREIMAHVACESVSVGHIMEGIPARDGDLYYHNTVHSKQFYGATA